MKIRIALTAAIAALALSGTGMAASLSDVVQKGEWADRIKEKNQLNHRDRQADREALRRRRRAPRTWASAS